MTHTHLTCLMLLQFVSMILFGQYDRVSYHEEAQLIAPRNSINKDEIDNPELDKSASVQSRHCYLLQDLDVPQPIGNQEIRTMLVMGDEVIVGGSFLHYDDSFVDVQTSGVFSYRVDGWGQGHDYNSLGNTIQGTVYDLELHNGSIYAAGDFVLAGTDFHNIAYYNGTDWVGIQTGNMNGTIRDIISYENQLYIGGDFTSVDGNSLANLAIWNGTSWSATPQNAWGQSATQALQVNAPVNTFEIYGDKLVVGGEFTQVNTTSAEGLFFLNNLTVESFPTHGSMTSVDNLEVYNSALVVGANKLYAYRSDKWYYPGDTIQEDESVCTNSYWQIPNIARTHEIYYAAPSNLWWYDDKSMNHLMISSGNTIYGLTCEPRTYSAIGDIYIDVNGPVYAMAKSQDTPCYVYAGDFTSAGFSNYDYNYCDEEALSTEDFFTLHNVVEAPIDLAEFTLKSNNNKTAQLKWTSLTESNSLHYEVQRKTDNEDFTRIGTVNAAGESIDKIDYTFDDDISTLKGEHVYYRLKMVDKDGSFEYSEVRSLKLKTSTTSEVSVYPNPTKNSLELNIQTPVNSDITVNIFDLQGKQLNSYEWTDNPNTLFTKRINVGHLENGLYLIEIITPNGRTTQKLNIIK